jgi:hypothetical protein
MLVQDNVLDKSTYDLVAGDSNFFPEIMGEGDVIGADLLMYHEEAASCFSPFMFWDGWLKSPANTLKKKVIQKIWENNLNCDLNEIVGFEYWTRTYKAGQYIDMHVDEDTFLYRDYKEYKGPLLGCVYYFCKNNDGGFLEIHKDAVKEGTQNALEKENIKKYVSPIEERERIAYKGNRVIIFDAGHVLHSSTPAKSGIRQVLVINVWHKDNPPTALEKNEFYYE